jgi:hypothetical protein
VAPKEPSRTQTRTAKKFPTSARRNVASSARAQEDVDRNGEAGSQTHTHLRALRQQPRPLPLHLRFRGDQTLLRLQFQPASATTGNRFPPPPLPPPPWRENQEATHLAALGRRRGVGRWWRLPRPLHVPRPLPRPGEAEDARVSTMAGGRSPEKRASLSGKGMEMEAEASVDSPFSLVGKKWRRQ